MQEAIEFSIEMMDKKMLTHAERQAEHKRKLDETSRNNQHQQQPFKRNNVTRAYTAMPGDKKPKIGHWARNCKSRPAANNNNNNNNTNNNNQRAQGENARGITCFKCGVQGHFKSECPKLKNGNQGNRAGNGNAVAKAYAVGTAGTNPISNVVTGTFLLNNRYASVLFDTGTDKSFVSTAFSSLIDIISTTLDHGYDVELADDRIIWKGVVHFGKRGTLNPRYIGPFKVLAKVGTVIYRLKLPKQLSKVHNKFHVSNLKKCLSDEPLAISLDEVHIDDKLRFVEEPVEVMDREVKRLKQSHIPIIKELQERS
nr:putative reverse transcriptase domain-containing protein [Tanacetum cinerariifolium]